MATINRYERLAYLKVGEQFELMGAGITGWTTALNATTASKQYVHQKTASGSLSGYAPVVTVTAEGFSQDAVVEYLMELGRTLDVSEKAHTELIIVDVWTDPTKVACKSTKVDVVVSIDNPGSGDSGAPLAVTASLTYEGDPIDGTFNVSTKAFAAKA